MRRLNAVLGILVVVALVGGVWVGPSASAHDCSSDPYDPTPYVGGVNHPNGIGYVDATGTLAYILWHPVCNSEHVGCYATTYAGKATSDPHDPTPYIGGVNHPNGIGYVDVTGTLGYGLWFVVSVFDSVSACP